LDILDGALVGAWSLKPFIIFYNRNQVGNCDMDQLENCNRFRVLGFRVQSYGINVQKTLNTLNKFYLAHFVVRDVPHTIVLS
jgi:hypothetical protein